jgi:RNA polymerase sigma-70 factor (ECF subfamily)
MIGCEDRDLARLVGAFVAGDAGAGEVLAQRALRLALRTAAAVVRDRGEVGDVAQEVVVETLRSVGGLREPAAFDAWVHRITVRVAARALERQLRRARCELTVDPEALAGWSERECVGAGVDPAESVTTRVTVADAVARLPARQRLALALRYVHDLSDVEIASALGCRVGTVHALLSRGRSALRDDPALAILAGAERLVA